MELQQGLERIQTIRHTESPAAYIKKRIGQAAQELSRAGDVQCHVELANEVLCRFVLVLYERDCDGEFSNIDAVTHRLLIPAPWGSSGWKLWGLRGWESDVLRSVLMERSTRNQPRPPLFDYNAEGRTWHLDATSYGNFALAQRFLQMEPVTMAAWRKHHAQWRHGKHLDNIKHTLRQKSKGTM